MEHGKKYKTSRWYRAFKKWQFVSQARRWSPDDQKRLVFYRQFVGEGDICFDVGANLGNRTKIFLKIGARVVAVEPQPRCAELLQAAFGKQPRFQLEHRALGARQGEAEMHISGEHTLSTLSADWMQAVRESGRFQQYTWDQRQTVQITTLDDLIARYGRPVFVKIDVEGYEFEVVSGLTQPVKALSLEFTPEYMESTWRAIMHLASLGNIRLNYSLGESMALAAAEWISPDRMQMVLRQLPKDLSVFGDIYVRFVDF